MKNGFAFAQYESIMKRYVHSAICREGIIRFHCECGKIIDVYVYKYTPNGQAI